MVEDAFELVGTEVSGVYRVDQVVAEGGFAVVYRAHHAGFRADVALKCLKIPENMTGARKERFREQFLAEAQLLFQLSARTPHVVRPLHVDAVTAPNGRFMPFIALEWLEGETLEAYALRRLASGKRTGSLEELVTLLTPVAEAIAMAHSFESEQGTVSIVHRDIKPENLFLARVGGQKMVKILDFGIGKVKSVATQIAGKASLEGSGLSSFTPAYGAPEQWLPRRFGQTGPWTDVWGLALTLVEVFVGHPIFDGDQAAVMGAAIDPERRPTPRNEGSDVSDRTEAVFEKALAVDPRGRYREMKRFWEDLTDSLRGCSTVIVDFGEEPDSVSSSREELVLGGSLPPGASLELASIPPGAIETKASSIGSTQARTRFDGDDPMGAGLSPIRAETELVAASAEHPLTKEVLRSGKFPVELRDVEHSSRVRSRWREFAFPGSAIFIGLLLTLFGQYYAAVSGRVFSIGPVGLGWVTIPLVLIGSALLFGRFLRRGNAKS